MTSHSTFFVIKINLVYVNLQLIHHFRNRQYLHFRNNNFVILRMFMEHLIAFLWYVLYSFSVRNHLIN